MNRKEYKIVKCELGERPIIVHRTKVEWKAHAMVALLERARKQLITTKGRKPPVLPEEYVWLFESHHAFLMSSRFKVLVVE